MSNYTPASDDLCTLESQFADAPASRFKPSSYKEPRGRAGGIARAATARRWASSGRFMSKEDDLAIWTDTFYEPYAKGGRIRAATAERDAFGRFMPQE